MIDRLVFLDESGANINLSRRYGRSIGKKRVVDHVPLNTPQSMIILIIRLSAKGTDGVMKRGAFAQILLY